MMCVEFSASHKRIAESVKGAAREGLQKFGISLSNVRVVESVMRKYLTNYDEDEDMGDVGMYPDL